MNPSLQKFDNQNSLRGFLNHMKLQIFNKEFDNLCKVSHESITEVLNKQEIQKQEPKENYPKTVKKRSNPESVLNKRKSPETEINEEELSLQSNFKLLKQEQITQATSPQEEKTYAFPNEEVAKSEQITLSQSSPGYNRPRIIQPVYIFHSNEQIGYVEVDVMDENAMKNIAQFLQNLAA